MGEIMSSEDQEFTDFMTEATQKAMELRQKYDKLSQGMYNFFDYVQIYKFVHIMLGSLRRGSCRL